MSDDVERVAAAERLAKEAFPNNRLMRLAFVEGYKTAALTASRSYSDEIEEGVTQEDRAKAWPYRPSCYARNDETKSRWMDGCYDDVAPVIQAFRAHRVAALKVQTGERHGQ